MNLKELKDKKIGDLNDMAKQLGIENGSGLRKQDLIFEILKRQSEKGDRHLRAHAGLAADPLRPGG